MMRCMELEWCVACGVVCCVACGEVWRGVCGVFITSERGMDMMRRMKLRKELRASRRGLLFHLGGLGSLGVGLGLYSLGLA